MRWNKQYLDILANKCSFEDEERYTEFLEALNAVANRYGGRLPLCCHVHNSGMEKVSKDRCSGTSQHIYICKWKANKSSATHCMLRI